MADKLSDEAQAELDEAFRILKEDKQYNMVSELHGHSFPKPPEPDDGKPKPPPRKPDDDPPPDDAPPKRRGGLWWPGEDDDDADGGQ